MVARKKTRSTPKPRRSRTRAAKPRVLSTATPASDDAVVTPRASTAVHLVTRELELKIPGDLLQEVSIFWSYVVRTRDRWISDENAYLSLVQQVQQRLEQWEIRGDALAALARADFVEVQIPARSDHGGWAARTLPWESLIAAATHPYPKERGGPVVFRHLVSDHRPTLRQPRNLLFVQSAPGRLSETYDFDEERKLVQTNSGLKPLPVLKDPTRNELASRISADRPDVVHFTGIDLHQGAVLLEKPDRDRLDGVYLAGDGGTPESVPSEQFAAAFGNAPPLLVACNLYHSAARITASLVHHGVALAIGIQDELDDLLIERFFGAFYRAWQEENGDVLAAFRSAIDRTSAYAPLRGSGIVLWSARSLVRAKTVTRPKKTLIPKREAPRPDGSNAREFFAIDVKPPREINYSLLHNGENIFEKFTITKLWPGPAEINVEVQLFAGQESFPYRTSIMLSADQEFVDLTKLIHAPLLSRFLRSNRDAVNTCLYVEVRYGTVELKRDTYPLRVLAVNEWKFDPNDDSRWLASFILSRDPAVARIVDAAERYVTALRDDIGSGFDGYQSRDEMADDPDEAIDLQVRAIWSALINDIPLSYINPPPTFTKDAQILRTPFDTVNGRRGTCIDLALLFAACLEYVEIHPVIFVLYDHAFPGYWRNEQSRTEFMEMKVAIDAGKTANAKGDQSFDEFDEVTQLVNSGQLIPLETVWLTRRLGFQEAVDAGLENLINRSDFGALLDVKLARDKGVMPLPIIGES
jgi:hypothetical protein